MKSRVLFVVLIVLYLMITAFSKYWLGPKLEELDGQKGAIMAKQFDKSLKPKDIINILTAFALENNDRLWVHSLEIDPGNVNLKIRSFNPEVIEKYLYGVAKRARLKIVNVQTRNVKYKASAEEQKEGENKPIPFAVKLYLDSLKNSANTGTNNDSADSDNSADKVFFAYEAEVKLSAGSN